MLPSPFEMAWPGGGGRQLAADVLEQMHAVVSVLGAAAGEQPRPPAYGILCFVRADRPLIGGTFMMRGFSVAWPKAAIKRLTCSGRVGRVPWLDRYTTVLADAFPPR